MHDNSDWGGTLARGLFAGLAGAGAMTAFIRIRNFLPDSAPRPLPFSAQEWDVTSRAANLILALALRREPTAAELKAGAALAHYAVGALAGVACTAAAKQFRSKTRWSGAWFGITMWVVANEWLLPELGLLNRNDYTWPMRMDSLGEHIVYGLTTDLVGRAINGGSGR